jgi:structural maintenance of chromosome 1
LLDFKSYKGHHTLLFGDSYFTSIIGPNGSGKSNSMDAISFVLGIKSSHLRSSHLKDLVYRGRVLKTSKINDDGSAAAPNGHADGDGGSDQESQKPGRNDPKSAWVMAVYEDDAGDEQKWKRTITNQGASEYRINDRVVTATQYNDAMEQENILIKARNFLVFQGDVETIASQSPKDLTRLIEQISGSLEHKAEYERLEEEAKQAAENQTYSMNRRRGMNGEIKQYQEQKKEAEAFQTKAEERDNAIVTHILWKLYHFQRVMEESSTSIQEHQENLKEYRRGVEKYEKALEEARASSSKVSKEVAKVEREMKRKEKEIEDQENSLIPIDEKVEITHNQIRKVRKHAADITKIRDSQAASLEHNKKQLATVEKAHKQFEIQHQETLKEQGKQLSAADFKQYNTLKSQVIAQTANHQSKLDTLLRQLKNDEMTSSSLKGKMDSAKSSVDRLESELNTVEEQRSATKASIKEILKEIDNKKKEFNAIKSERVRVNQLHTEKEEKLQALLRTLSEADDGRRQNEREHRTKEMVISLKRLFPGVRGRVGELCKPKQKKYDEAVITALGRDFDSVVVDTEKTGTECVQYLKDQRFSPMTFIPLDNIKTNNANSNLKGLKGARLTIDCIDFDSSLERAMSYACGSSIVCDDLAIAKHICYEKKMEVKAVTLEGFVIHKAGLMTGGRGPEGKGGKRKFEAQHDIDGLKAKCQQMREEIEALPNVNRKTTAEEQLQSDLSGLEQRLEYAKSELAAFEQNLSSKKKEFAHEERLVSEYEPKYLEKQSGMERLQGKVVEFKNAVSKVEDKIFSDFCKRLGYSDIRTYEAQQGSLEQEASQKRNEFERQKQSLRSQLNWGNSQFNETDARVKMMEKDVKKQEQAIENFSAEKAALEEAIDTERAKLTELEDTLHKHKERLLVKNEKVTAARNELQKQSKEIDSRTKAITVLEAEGQRNSAGRYALLRRCKLEQIAIPLTEASGKLETLPDNENLLEIDPDAMDVDEGDDPEEVIKDYGLEVDFEELDDDLKVVGISPTNASVQILIFYSLMKTALRNN